MTWIFYDMATELMFVDGGPTSSCDLYLTELFHFGHNFQPFQEKREKPHGTQKQLSRVHYQLKLAVKE